MSQVPERAENPHTDINQKPTGWARVVAAVRDELAAFNLRLAVAHGVISILPINVGKRLRVYLLRAAGFQIGHGTIMSGTPTFVASDAALVSRLKIGEHSKFNIGCVFDLTSTITIGDRVGVGHEVLFLTSSHQIGPRHERLGPLTSAPIVIGDGVWIGARCMIYPGVTVGEGSVISANTHVTRDVPPHTLVNGTKNLSLARWR